MNTDSVTVERTFEVTGQARLTLLNVSGDIDIRAGDDGRIEARAVKHPGRGASRTEIEMTQAPDGAVTVATRYVGDLVSRLLALGHGEPTRVDYVVRVPRGCDLDVSYVSGTASLAGMEGAARVRSVSGSQRLADLAGSLDLKTVSGSIEGQRLRLAGPLGLNTISGNVTLTDCHLPGVTAHTVSGWLRLDRGTAAGAYRLNSVSGNVSLTLPAGAVCDVHLSSLSGRLRSSLPAVRSAAAGQEIVEVTFHSVSGDLHLEPGGPGLAAEAVGPAPAEPEPAATPGRSAAERLAVLERVSRGELTIDAALGALKP